MRWLTVLLVVMLIALQYPLWWGAGGWLKVRGTQSAVAQQQSVNQNLSQRNAALDAEVLDLKQGLGAVEERARMELGMVRHNELFFQILDAPADGAEAHPSPTVTPIGNGDAQ